MRYPDDFHPRCLKCNYDLVGLDVRQCPECATRAELHYLLWEHQNKRYARSRKWKERVDVAVSIMAVLAGFSALLTMGQTVVAVLGAITSSALTIAARWVTRYGLDSARWRPAILLAPVCGAVLASTFWLLGPDTWRHPWLTLATALPFLVAGLLRNPRMTIRFLAAFLSALLPILAFYWLGPAIKGTWHGWAYTSLDRPWDIDSRPTLLKPRQALMLGLVSLAALPVSMTVALVVLRFPHVRRIRRGP